MIHSSIGRQKIFEWIYTSQVSKASHKWSPPCPDWHQIDQPHCTFHYSPLVDPTLSLNLGPTLPGPARHYNKLYLSKKTQLRQGCDIFYYNKSRQLIHICCTRKCYVPSRFIFFWRKYVISRRRFSVTSAQEAADHPDLS